MTTQPPITITQDVRLMVATPLVGGAQAQYLRALISLHDLVRAQSYECACVWCPVEETLDRTRNALVGAFLASESTHLLLVDGDIGFSADDVIEMIDLMQSDAERAVIAVPCPKRQINWPLVAAASAAGLGHDEPARLERYGGQFALALADPEAGLALDQLVELAWIGSSLMLIRRDVLETLCAQHPALAYLPEAADVVAEVVPERLFALFQSTIDPVSSTMMPGDMLFCARVRAAGFRIWLAAWMRATTTGSARFIGSLGDLADLSPAQPD